MSAMLCELAISAGPDRARALHYPPTPYPPRFAASEERVRCSIDEREAPEVEEEALTGPESLRDFVVRHVRAYAGRYLEVGGAQQIFRLSLPAHTDVTPAPEHGSRSPDVAVHVTPGRRSYTRREPPSVPFAIDLRGPAGPSAREFVEDYLDAFSREALAERAGADGSGYVVTRDAETRSEVVHASVGSIGEAGALVASLRGGGVPRLLVLAGADEPADLDGVRLGIAATAIQAGCDAVLWVSAGPEFIREFYRKLLHNAPLDAAVALSRASGPARLPLLMVRPGGEYTLSLGAATEQRKLLLAQALRRTKRGPTRGPAATPDTLAATFERNLAEPARATLASPGVEQLLSALDTAKDASIALSRGFQNSLFDREEHELRGYRRTQDALSVHTELARVATDRARGGDFLRGLAAAVQRYTQVDVRDDEGQAIDRAAPLCPGRWYHLVVQITAERREALARFAFPEAAVERLLAQEGQIAVDVHVFHEDGDLRFESRRGSLRLPAYGPTGVLSLRFCAPVDAERPVRRLRVALYSRDNLLQSVGLALPVAPGRGGPVATLDYCATADFAAALRWRRPAMSIVTNDAGGNFWFGVRRGQASALASYDQELPALVGDLRDRLFAASGGANYLYDADAFAPEGADEDRLKEREQALVTLAAAGWQLYKTVLGVGDDAMGAGKAELRELLGAGAKDFAGGLVQVARCRPNEPTMPWALLYDQPLWVGDARIHLCPIFMEDVRDNRWEQAPDGRRRLTVVQDRLGDPAACRGRPECALESADVAVRKTTVCPFGFWGHRYEIEQPLQGIATGAQAREVLGVVVRIPPVVPARATVCGDPKLAESTIHTTELAAVLTAAQGTIQVEQAIDRVREVIADPAAPVCYFFCHGQQVPVPLPAFGFRFADDAYLFASDLDDSEPPRRRFLMVLNACGSVGLLPEQPGVADFLYGFRALGAEGVIGAEIKVHTHLARPFGLQLLSRFYAGQPVGRAMLEIRREMLRQLNPMGLAYTLHGPAGLHLCPKVEGCVICEPPA